jgi:ligand-binding sensor domain-containing protein/signal transduction histidine kinase
LRVHSNWPGDAVESHRFPINLQRQRIPDPNRHRCPLIHPAGTGNKCMQQAERAIRILTARLRRQVGTGTLHAVCLLCFAVSLKAQQPSYRIYSTEDGLPSDELYDVIEDRLGEIWIASDRGIARYDGYRFKTYSTADGLASNTNFMLEHDGLQRIWTNSVNGRLSCFSRDSFRIPVGQQVVSVQNTYTTFILSRDNKPIVPLRMSMANLNDINRDIREFHSPVAAYQNVPVWYELSDTGFKPFQADTMNLKRRGRFFLLAEGAEHALIWVRGAGVLKALKTPAGWLMFTHKQLILWETGNNTLQFSPVFNTLLLQNVFLDSAAGRLMVATRSGLAVFNGMQIAQPPVLILPQFNFTACERDREGNFWLSTWNQGLVKVPCIDLLNLAGASVLGEARILSLLTFQGRLFLGNSEGHVFSMDAAHRLQQLDNAGNGTGDQNQPIDQFNILGDTLWSSYGKAWRIQGDKTLALQPFLQSARAVFRDRQFHYIVGFRVNRIWRNTSTNEGYLQSTAALIHKRLYSALESRNGETWLGTSDGLYLLRGDDTQRINPKIDGKFPLKGRITDIREIPERNVLLVATRDAGLAIRYGNTWLHAGSGEWLVSPMINRIYVESENLVWLCTNKGVNRLHLQYIGTALRITGNELYTVEQGLPSGFVNDMAVFSGNYYFATNKGLSFIPVSLLAPSNVPPVINALQLSTTDSTYPNLQEQIEIGPWLNDLAIQFNAISFRKPAGAAFYRYRISGPGLSKAWTYTDQTSIRLLNLDPGNYLFELQARNNNHVWCQPSTIRFTIRPGFTQTLWFPLLMALLLLLGLLLIFFLYRKSVQRKQRLNQQIKDAQLKQKTTELELLRNQMNPHFIYNSLNSIQSYIHSGDFEGANDYIVRFSDLMRNTLTFSRLDVVSLDRELEFLENYLHLEQKRFSDKFTYRMVNTDGIDPEDYLVHPLILQPILENAVKHAFRGIAYAGEITIAYRYLSDGHCLEFTVDDNGKGFVPEAQPANGGSYGLQIVRRRLQILAEQHPEARCGMQVISDGGREIKGTHIVIHIPSEPKWN